MSPVARAGTMVLPCLSHATHMPFSCLLGAAFLPALKFCGYDYKRIAGLVPYCPVLSFPDVLPGPVLYRTRHGPFAVRVEHSTMNKTRGNLGRTRKNAAWTSLPIEMIQIEMAHLAKGIPVPYGL